MSETLHRIATLANSVDPLDPEHNVRLLDMIRTEARAAVAVAPEQRIEALAKAKAAYEADPVDARDRPSSWRKLRELLGAADAVIHGEAVAPGEQP